MVTEVVIPLMHIVATLALIARAMRQSRRLTDLVRDSASYEAIDRQTDRLRATCVTLMVLSLGYFAVKALSLVIRACT